MTEALWNKNDGIEYNRIYSCIYLFLLKHSLGGDKAIHLHIGPGPSGRKVVRLVYSGSLVDVIPYKEEAGPGKHTHLWEKTVVNVPRPVESSFLIIVFCMIQEKSLLVDIQDSGRRHSRDRVVST